MVDHPQLFDPLPAPVEQALRASIERFGVLVPIVRDQHGGIIDGRHRARIADGLRIKYRVDTINVADEHEAREIQRTLNADRRHLTEEQRRQVAVALRKEGHSIRSIASALGVGKSTIADDVKTARLSGAGQSEPERVTRQGGGSYPARRPTVVSARSEREAQQARQALQMLGDAAPPDDVDTKRVERMARRQAASQPRADLSQESSPALRPMSATERAESERAQQESMEQAAEQVALNRWLYATDGLTEALSYARTENPPHNIPDNYVPVSEFRRRLAVLVDISATWEGS